MSLNLKYRFIFLSSFISLLIVVALYDFLDGSTLSLIGTAGQALYSALFSFFASFYLHRTYVFIYRDGEFFWKGFKGNQMSFRVASLSKVQMVNFGPLRFLCVSDSNKSAYIPLYFEKNEEVLKVFDEYLCK